MSILKFVDEDPKKKWQRELLKRLEDEPRRQWEYFYKNNSKKCK